MRARRGPGGLGPTALELALMVLVLLAGAAPGDPGSPLPAQARPAGVVPDLEPLLDSISTALHEGDYALARRLLEQAYRTAPSDPGVLFFQAFALAWEGALNLRSLASDPAFAYLLDSIEVNGERQRAEGREEGRTSYYVGMAALVRARTRFNGEKHELFKAAADARRGMRALERAIELGYEAPDASFWTGAYRATASSLPVPLRALRALVGLPGGGREQAVEELRRAFEHGRRFRLEASLFLAGALAEDHDPDYVQAVDVLCHALPEFAQRGSLLPLFAGELLAEWGLTPQAMTLWDGVLERQAKQPELYGTSELARLRMDLAGSMEQEMRWSEAIPHLRAILERADLGSPRLRQRAALMLARCQARLGLRAAVEAALHGFVGSDRIRRQIASLLAEPLPEPRVEEQVAQALGPWNERGASAARPLLEKFLLDHPEHVAGLLHAGRAAFELGLDEDAARHFEALLRLGSTQQVSPDAVGWTHMYLGWLADRARRREQAQEHYRTVEQLKAFDAWRGGALYAQVSYRGLPSREPDVWAILRPALTGAEMRAAGEP